MTCRKPGFRPGTVVSVTWIKPHRVRVDLDMSYDGSRQTFIVPRGTETDLASVPWFLTSLIPIDVAVASSILHDRLWELARQTEAGTAPEGQEITYAEADGILRQALRTEGIGVLKRWSIWAAVRWGALAEPGGRRGWWADSPQVILVTATVGPVFILAPAVINAVFGGGFRGLDALLSAPERRAAQRADADSPQVPRRGLSH